MQYKAEVSLLKQLQCSLQKSSVEHEQSCGDVPAQAVESRRAPESSSEFVVRQVKLWQGVQIRSLCCKHSRTHPAPPEGSASVCSRGKQAQRSHWQRSIPTCQEQEGQAPPFG